MHVNNSAWLLGDDGEGIYVATKDSEIAFKVSEIIRVGLIRKLTAIVVWASSVKRYHKVTLNTPVS